MNVKHNRILTTILSVILLFSLTSCVDDLNVTPIDPSTNQTFNQDSVFAKIYASLALTGQQGPSGNGDLDGIDEGTSSFIRLVWNLNELTTDEAISSWGDPGVPEMNFNKWTASHDQVEGMYSRLYFDITICNHFLEKTTGQTDEKSVKQRAEARFMRALNYFYLMDMFGSVPFTETVSTVLPQQISRADLFAWIEKELLEIEPDMYEPQQAPYYRADQVADWLLLSRLYLNAEVYTGTAHWTDAAKYAAMVINSGYTLCPTYGQLFMADNAGSIDGSTVNQARKEIILPIACDGVYTRSWGNSIFLIASTRTSGMPDWGSTAGWGGNRARAALAYKFFPNGLTDDDLSNETATTLQTKAGDDRAMFWGWTTGDSKGTTPYSITKYTVFKQGLSVTKYTNVRADGGEVGDVQYTDTDVPLLRVGEAYLTYAEAVYRGGDMVNGYTALSAVNDLRTRSHASTLNTLSLETLCDEWSREFYFEGRRRMDLIRFGYYGGSDYTWDWKGGSEAGSKFSVNYNLFPIPTSDLSANSNLVQNPGY